MGRLEDAVDIVAEINHVVGNLKGYRFSAIDILGRLNFVLTNLRMYEVLPPEIQQRVDDFVDYIDVKTDYLNGVKNLLDYISKRLMDVYDKFRDVVSDELFASFKENVRKSVELSKQAFRLVGEMIAYFDIGNFDKAIEYGNMARPVFKELHDSLHYTIRSLEEMANAISDYVVKEYGSQGFVESTFKYAVGLRSLEKAFTRRQLEKIFLYGGLVLVGLGFMKWIRERAVE